MIDVIRALAILRPDLLEGVDYLAVDHGDGFGPQLVWYADGDPPSVSEMAAALAGYKPPIASVSPRQARLALLASGVLDKVEAAVKVAGGATQIAWDYATIINRTDPLIDAIGQQLSLSSDQIDKLFEYAATQ